MKTKRNDVSTLGHLLLSSASVSVATIITHPIDVVKVHMQLNSVSAASGEAFSIQKFFSYFPKLYQQFGISQFYSGIGAALTFVNALFLLLVGKERRKSTNTVISTTAAIGSGCIAAVIGNPFEVIKVRMQSDVSQYANMFHGIRSIVMTEGILRFWRGVIPGMARSGLLTASQIGPYQYTKQTLQQFTRSNSNPNANGLWNQFTIDLVASLCAGIVSTTVTSPVDVIKTRVMNNATQQSIRYFAMAKYMFVHEGWGSFFRGWMANYVRLGPQTTCIFITYEYLCKIIQIESF
ncbi:hypothetical protein RFI_12329 [Reticulomyxa filosa]|uniref:Uncharacterized protein n=1 Tax=Reticulomyxa filosa TaxID=46433 RepID=X6NGF1_RETFI|nr:hypothetical protein RFI_12329 [Reticulomyxa filosa]|eukprot:ETO24829.1 hypothetical protein RFI_12329 [Reticulomyxa filosa]